VPADAALAAARRVVVRQEMRRLRAAKGWTQEDLAHRAGFDRDSIRRFENGVYSPSLDRRFLLAEALETAPSELVAPADRPRGRRRRG
jgi:transcriptional regulator with XRE-family HTH domain